MSNEATVYLNGELVRYSDAKVSVEDRGFLFAEGVYELMRVVGGRVFRLEAHLDRLERSARALDLQLPITREDLGRSATGVAAKNEIEEGTVYVQLTRGAAPRAQAYPANMQATLVMIARPFAGGSQDQRENGVSAITAPDIRWGLCEVKTIGLLPNVMAGRQAVQQGAYEVIFVRDGVVTEGSRSSTFCVRAGTVYTHPIDNILPSITRQVVIDLLKSQGVDVQEVGVRIDEFREADEIFLTGTMTEVTPVVELDGTRVADGEPGEMTGLAFDLYMREVEAVRSGLAGPAGAAGAAE